MGERTSTVSCPTLTEQRPELGTKLCLILHCTGLPVWALVTAPATALPLIIAQTEPESICSMFAHGQHHSRHLRLGGFDEMMVFADNPRDRLTRDHSPEPASNQPSRGMGRAGSPTTSPLFPCLHPTLMPAESHS